MPFYDFVCELGHKEEVWYKIKDLPEHHTCSICGHWAVQLFSGPRNFIHATLASRYGKYDPMLGEFVEDYSHHQKLMKQYDVQESNDPVGGSRSHVPAEYTGDKAKDEAPRKRGNDTARWVDSGDVS